MCKDELRVKGFLEQFADIIFAPNGKRMATPFPIAPLDQLVKTKRQAE
jgi:hypothetical protein